MGVESLPLLPVRDPRGHKGTFGTVAVVGGCCSGGRAMIGAPALAALGALRAGAGLAKLVMPSPILSAGVAMAPSATGIELEVSGGDGAIVAHSAAQTLDRVISESDSLVVGPGLGAGEGVSALVLRAIQQEEVPLVLDADGLNALAGIAEVGRDFRARAVVTPHPGEFARLAKGLAISEDVSSGVARERAAEALAQKLGCVVVLKGAGTVVSDGHRTWVCGRGHACLATAGTGDVLAGVIAGLAGQFARHGMAEVTGRSVPGVLSLFDVARIGVEAHAIAGEAWARVHGAAAGMLAAELAEHVPGVLEKMRRGSD